MKKFQILSLTLVVAIAFASCSYKEDVAKLKKRVDRIEKDSDKDGVSNAKDKDNRSPEGAKAYGNGMVWDSDGDGVGDYKDEELFSPREAEVDSLGRAKDTDGDGVPDASDKEPGTPEGALVNFEGRSAAGAGSGGGIMGAIPNAEVTGKFPTLIFSEGTNIESLSYMGIIEVYNFMAVNPGVKVKITGHTDSSETDKDVELGQQRADKVAQELTSMGIDKSLLMVESKGKSQPANAVSKLNRRVAFELAR